ncbi:hypothetical protein JCM8202_004229 [Rhodotorula sphaerocarpa]
MSDSPDVKMSHSGSMTDPINAAAGAEDQHAEAETGPQPKELSEQELADGLRQLRTDFRTAAIAHFSVLFLHHLGGTFDTDDFELDLLGVKPGAQVPALLGKILNTLANDRNCNSSNWLNALRRSYNRRVTERSDNPFYSWHRVPGSVVEAERALERERETAEWEARFGGDVEAAKKAAAAAAAGEGQGQGPPTEASRYADFAAQEQKLQEAQKAMYRASSKHKAREAAKSTPPAAAAAGAETAASEVAPSEAAAEVPMTKEAVDDGFNADMADVIAEDAAAAQTDAKEPAAQGEALAGAGPEEPVKAEEAGAEAAAPAAADEEEEWYEEQRAVDWEELSLKTKLDAIYNVCEWHMVDPERQFRKYLHWDGEAAWRLDPIGKDADGNQYYHTADDRLWMQRPVPPSNAAQPSGQPLRRPRTLLGLQAGPRDKSKKGTVTGVMRFKLRKNPKTGDFEQDPGDDEEVEGDEGAKGEEGEADEAEGVKTGMKSTEEQDAEIQEWEREYWEERVRADNTPGFVEWEAVCITLDDWRAFPERFASSKNRDEVRLRDLLENELVPTIEEETSRRIAEREAEIAEQEKKRLTRAQTREEEENRLAAERIAASDRGTRSSRHAVKSNAEDVLAGGVASSEASRPGSDAAAAAAAAAAKAAGELREERLRKREEEKRRHEEEQERKMMEELREREREEAREKNGGKLPVELMTVEEKAAHEAELAAQRKAAELEAKKEIKRARDRERRAMQKAKREAASKEEAEAAARAQQARAAEEAARAAAAAAASNAAASTSAAGLGGEADEAWYLDCEVCGVAGWNYDDGQGLICCDHCEDWQHLPCHIYADEAAGRPPQPYTDESFNWVCGYCREIAPRRPRPPKPAPGAPPTIAYAQFGVQDASGAGHKRKASASNGSAAGKKPKTGGKQPKPNGQSIPYGHGAHPLYHPSAYSHPHAAPGSYSPPAPHPPAPGPAPAPAAAAPAAAPEPQPQQAQQASMSYEQLKAAVEANPALMQQLPPEYQVHFSQLLGLPIPP